MQRKHRYGKWVLTALSAGLTLALLGSMALGSGQAAIPGRTGSVGILDKYDTAMGNAVSDALEGVLSIEKRYWLDDENPVAPRPNPAKAGETQDAQELSWLLEEAEDLLGLEDPLFQTDVELLPGSKVRYYLDETIFSVSWKQVVGSAVYSFAEVKIAHPSQIRRFLSDGRYGSGTQYLTSTMAKNVNAVTACSGDFYAYRGVGTTVYNGQVCRAVGDKVDICFVDGKGDLVFSPRGELQSPEETEAFVKENDIRFSLAFGPVLLEEGEVVPLKVYSLGEPFGEYSRAALCQQGPLHYVVVTANMEAGRTVPPTIPLFAYKLHLLGIKKAYALDGGQTATLVANGQVVNKVDYGEQRRISDILYFATALPEASWEGE